MTIIISLGGSVINPGKINKSFTAKFRNMILETSKKERVVIVCGGGSVAREYATMLRKFNKNKSELDWMGIYATYLNSYFIKSIFKEKAYEKILTIPKKAKTNKRILIGSGWKPGRSTDYDAVKLAIEYEAKYVLNLSNIKYLYDKDPKYKNAKKIKDISWKEYLNLIGTKWKPSMNVPFDPIASKLAMKKRKEAVLMNGRNINNIKRFLKGKDFKGTWIR